MIRVGVLQACAYTCTYKRVCTDKRMDANKQETCRQSGTSQDMRLSIACTASRDCCCSIRSEISSPATSSPTFLALVDRPRSTTCTHPQDRAREREREDERPRQRKCQIESRELGIQQSLQLTQQYSSVCNRATIRECESYRHLSLIAFSLCLSCKIHTNGLIAQKRFDS